MPADTPSPPPSAIEIRALDHLVLTVRDLACTLAFYSGVLGMREIRTGAGRVALGFGAQKINLHLLGQAIGPRAGHLQPGSADLCLLTSLPAEETVARLRTHSVTVVAGPVERDGAGGRLCSVYCRDPDANLIELAHPLYEPCAPNSPTP